MKRLSLAIIFLLSMQFCLAQTIKNSLSKQHLKGRVKKIESLSYSLASDSDKLDTLAPHSKSIYLYAENGNEIEDSYFDKNGLPGSKMVNKYNERNENIEEDYYGKNGIQESTTIFKYDEKGNLIEADYTNTSDKVYREKTLYLYDGKGNYVEDEIYNDDGGLRYKDTYKYDSNGNRTELNYWHANEDTIRVRWTFSYNEAGNLLGEGRYSPGGELEIENTFTYGNPDKAGNWQLETRKSKGQSKKYAAHSSYSVTTRRIYYY